MRPCRAYVARRPPSSSRHEISGWDGPSLSPSFHVIGRQRSAGQVAQQPTQQHRGNRSANPSNRCR
ncbi:uncharacterized protein LOC144872786 isoform X2 [Branchiostoma floridae x Branchiostoma japonicum]